MPSREAVPVLRHLHSHTVYCHICHTVLSGICWLSQWEKQLGSLRIADLECLPVCAALVA
jgi:hypothetical protein